MYQVLYRKYRPKCFSDVYGQDHIISTLKNELNNGRISHAYLFTGSRGTGKTTCAKILAKAVNCENLVDGEPCNECDVCKGLDNGTIYDVVEMDAASNRRVENIRDILEEVNYTPTRGKYRVYIIDEVHMLTPEAFNALLKTLEEPPAHVIFILATTEVYKIPATILSRCQRFDFKRIQPETMSKRLKEVASLENFELDDDAAILISRIADGALRNGLSLLDQCVGVSKHVDAKIVSDVAGIASKQALYDLTDYICNKDSNGAISEINELYQNSYDMQQLCVELINHFRNLLVVKTVKKNRSLIISTDDEYNSIVEAANKFTLENIIYILNLLQSSLVTIKSGANARIEVEMTFIKLCEPRLEESIDALLDRIAALERAVRNGVSVNTNNVANSINKAEDVNNSNSVGNSSIKPDYEESKSPIENIEAMKKSYFENKSNNDFASNENKVNDDVKLNDIKLNEENAPIEDIVDEPPFDSPYNEPVDEIPPYDPPYNEPIDDVPQTENIKEQKTSSVQANDNANIQPSEPQIQNVQPAKEEDNKAATKVEFDRWGEFLQELAKHDMPMYGLLSSAKGYVRGNTFIIHSSNMAMEEILKSEKHANSIKRALFNVTGVEYVTKLAKSKDQNKIKRDPLEDFISNASGTLNIDLK